jgi:hypothetical protein
MRSNSAGISINNITELEKNQHFKIEAIIKCASFHGDSSRPVFYMIDNPSTDSLNIFLTIGSQGERVFLFGTGGKYGDNTRLKAVVPNGLENTWFKIGAEYHNGIRKILINDSCLKSDTIAPIRQFPSGYSTKIGNDTWGDKGWYFNSDIDELKISVYNTNQNPIFTSNPDTIALENHFYTYPIKVSDPDSDKVTLSLISAPTDMLLINDTIIFTPKLSQQGNHEISIRALDSRGASTLQNYTLKVLPRSGQIILSDITPPGDTVIILESDSVTFSITATSRNPNAEISFQWYKNEPMVASTNSYKLRTNYQSAGICSVKVIAYDGIEFIEKKWIVNVKNVQIKPIIITPIEDHSASGDSLFSWTCSDPDLDPATTKYDIQFMRNSQPNTIILSLSAITTNQLILNTVINRNDLPEGAILRWKVRAYDGDGDTLLFSEHSTFFYTNFGTAIEKGRISRNVFMASPNPFNPHTTIIIEDNQAFKDGIVMISDIAGRIVNRFKISKTTPIISFSWNGKNMYNDICPAGQYICTISSNEYRKTMKLILSK